LHALVAISQDLLLVSRTSPPLKCLLCRHVQEAADTTKRPPTSLPAVHDLHCTVDVSGVSETCYFCFSPRYLTYVNTIPFVQCMFISVLNVLCTRTLRKPVVAFIMKLENFIIPLFCSEHKEILSNNFVSYFL